MNYVGQLAETVFVTVKELYRGLNPATLTGGIDVIVVRQPDGSYQCSPFHVRFGKLGVLRSKEKVVDIEINGEPVSLHMKLGDNGEAFFVEENEDFETRVPAHLCTSPIPTDVPEVSEVIESLSSTASSSNRRKKRRRKRARSDTHVHEDASSSSDEKESLDQDVLKEESLLAASKSVYYSLSEELYEEPSGAQNRDVHPHSEGECSVNESVFFSRPSPPKSDSELCKPQESLGPQMQWNWGAFPKVCQAERDESDSLRDPPIMPSDHSHFRTIHRQASIDMESTDSAATVTVVRPEPQIGTTGPVPSDDTRTVVSSSVNTQLDVKVTETHVVTFQSADDSFPQAWTALENKETKDFSVSSTDSDTQTCNITSSTNTMHGTSAVSSAASSDTVFHVESQETGDENNVSVASKIQTVTFGETETNTVIEAETEVNSADTITVNHSVGGSEEGAGLETSQTNQNADSAGVTPALESIIKSEDPVLLETSKATVSQDKKKVKRNHHLGPSDIYLDDLSRLDPEAAALYFPKSETESSDLRSTHGPDPSPPSGQLSPQSLGSTNADSGTEYLSDSTTDTLDVTMSLCGRGDISQISKEKFMEHLVKYQDFVNNPGIVEDPNLVICINSKYYNWAVAAPMILSVQAFQKTLPKSTIEQLVKDKMPKKSGRWWFSWRRKDLNNIAGSQKPDAEGNQLEASAAIAGPSSLKSSVELSSDEDGSVSMRKNSEAMDTAQCISQMYRKSLRLTSEQIESLNLREGANTVVFSVTTQYQGTCRCEAAIYLWSYDDKIIISDIDGTITKSDALGHILPQLGKDWTHHGIAKLYHKIHQNGYKFLYCSARAIGMADITKGYLQWVNDQGTVLPKGPVLLAPSSLFSALHREVIEKKPEVFKIACLTDIRDLFSPVTQPFYAAFGNRTNDAYAYKEVGVPETRIFTVNPKGELIQEKTKGNKSSYSHLSELVDHFFPFICKDPTTSFDCPEFSHFSFWREPLPPLDLADLI
ncbi:phosphatidate phosphatase LPIN2-like isoform X2 [Sinocyclocheilus rhinocerous]|uniref:phosphatidate phosphatase n=2 Tax=Sinocyclocheilus rhinocerous TaxID=307959 RepID=A0A673M7M1_9TELE|nr:PREDICTED: phosphatidate phosphatase LPIN2-like isoform X2 [Sinocyclocheilus rhinocerous]